MGVRDPKGEDALLGADGSAPTATIPARASTVGPTARATAGLRVVALGVSAWLVAIAVPMAEGGLYSSADGVLAVLPLIALAAGARAFVRGRADATSLLALAFPTLLATGIAGRADPMLSDRYGTPLLILSSVAILAYVVAVAHALGRPAKLRETRITKLVLAPDTTARARRLRTLVLATTTGAGLFLTIVVPALGSRTTYAASWGESADEGRVLTAIVAAAVATVALSVIIAPALRAPRVGEGRSGGDAVAVTASLVLAATFAMAWGILLYVGRT